MTLSHTHTHPHTHKPTLLVSQEKSHTTNDSHTHSHTHSHTLLVIQEDEVRRGHSYGPTTMMTFTHTHTHTIQNNQVKASNDETSLLTLRALANRHSLIINYISTTACSAYTKKHILFH